MNPLPSRFIYMISRISANTRTLIIFFLLLLCPIRSYAQSTKQQIEELKQEIQAIRMQTQQQIEQLKRKIQQLENTKEQTDQNITQINQKQVEAEDAWYNNFLSKYDSGFEFETKDKSGIPFKMRFGILAQVQGYVNDTTGQSVATSIEMNRLQLRLEGYAFKSWFYYTFMIDPTKSSSILRDMYLTAAYQKEISPRVGQWKVPFQSEELTSSATLQFVERSFVNSQFTLKRDVGAALMGGIGANNNFSYSVGVFNGDGNNGQSVDSNMLYAGRIQFGLGGEGNNQFNSNGAFGTAPSYDLVPDFAINPTFIIGAAAAAIPGLDCNVKTPNGGVCPRVAQLQFGEVDFSQIEADIHFKMRYFNVEGEYDGRWLNPTEGPQSTAYDQGFRVQAGVFLVPKTLELAARYAWIGYDTSSGVVPAGFSEPDEQWEITSGLNYYISHSHRWKVQLTYTYQKDTFTENAPSTHTNVARTQLEANF
jgi:phosphate-selective porin OprO/OprP